MTRLWLLLLLLFALPVDAATLNRGNGAEPETLDPSFAGTQAEDNIIGDLMMGLTTDAPDGSAIVLRTYLSVLVFERPEGTSVVEALEARPCRAPSPDERQGESLTVLPDASGFVTASEGGDQPLWLVAARPG